MLLSDQIQKRKTQFLLRKAHEYCFQYYLRKGIRLNPELLVKTTLEEVRIQIEQTPTLIVEAFFDWLSALPYAARWEDIHFVKFFYYGNGNAVTLEQIGHLEDIKRAAAEDALLNFREQIAKKAYEVEDGPFTDSFENVYDFGSVQFSHGESTMTGEFTGEVKWVHGGVRRFIGKANISFKDTFKDPLDMIQVRERYNEYTGHVNEWLARHFNVSQELIPKIEITNEMVREADVGGSPYDILGKWEEEMAGEVIKP